MRRLHELKALRSFPRGTRVALCNGRIADVAHGGYYELGTTLVLQGERIVSLVEPFVPATAEVQVDLEGRAVLPGLFNTHCHVQLKLPTLLPRLGDLRAIRQGVAAQVDRRMADCAARGVTHLRDALGADLHVSRGLSERIGHGELAGPRIHQAVLVAPLGGAMSQKLTPMGRLRTRALGSEPLDYEDATSGIVTFAPEASAEAVRAAVDRAIDERGARQIKFYDQQELMPGYRARAAVMSTAQLDAAADQARKRGVPTVMHHTTVESFRRGVRAGVGTLAHLASDGAISYPEARAAAEAGIIVEPTLTVGYCLSWPEAAARAGLPWAGEWLPRVEAYRQATYAPLMEASWPPGLAALALAMPERVRQGRTRAAGVMEMGAAFRYWAPALVQGIENLRMLHAAGVTLACGTDAGAVPVAEGLVGLELELLWLCLNTEGEPLHFGPADALRSATLYSARALGLEGDYGTLEPGKVADLVVIDGDPFTELDLIGSLAAAVAKAGVWVGA